MICSSGAQRQLLKLQVEMLQPAHLWQRISHLGLRVQTWPPPHTSDSVPNVSWDAYTMYKKPSSSFSLSYTSEMGVDTLTMLCPLTSRKKAWLALSCKRRLGGMS